MTEPATKRAKRAKFGSTRPRLAPPTPARDDHKAFVELGAKLGLTLYPWQGQAARYLTARGPVSWLWPEVATIVARQNGKTTVLELLVISRLLKGLRVAHAAQNRNLPRESHRDIAHLLKSHFPDQVEAVRFAGGQEEIHMTNGGSYRIVAPTRGGARGLSVDLFVVDELLDFDDWDFISAAKPTVMASPEGQVAYFSNAGDPNSVVLNSLRTRADNDPSLAYLEWSAEPDLAPDDVKGWLQANPAAGHNPVVMGHLEREFRAHQLGESMPIWEREYLCRWASAAGMTPFVQPEEWERVDFELSSAPRRPTLGVKVDASGERASAVVAWPIDGGVALQVVADVFGDPVNIAAFGPDLAKLATSLGVFKVVFDPYTDADLARYLRRASPLIGREYASASEKFVHLTLTKQLSVRDPDGILKRDLGNTVRAQGAINAQHGYLAVKSSPEVTNTTVEAAIRAAWTASAPTPRVVVY